MALFGHFLLHPPYFIIIVLLYVLFSFRFPDSLSFLLLGHISFGLHGHGNKVYYYLLANPFYF